jgi:hypothetical protein
MKAGTRAKRKPRATKVAKAAQKKAALPEFVIRAQRAFGRVARKLRAESRALGLPLVVWKDGKVTKELM